MLRFSFQETGKLTFGFFSALVLLTSIGFIRVHVSRTGDHDAPLAVMGWLALLYFYKYLQNDQKEARHLWVFTGMLIGAALTKSVAGLFFGPALLIYSLYKKQFLKLIKSRNFWIAASAYILVVGGFYLTRELEHPGFLKSMWKGELGGHYLKTRDGHLWPWYWYAVRLYKLKFMPWLLLLPLGAVLLLRKNNQNFKDFGLLLLLGGISWLSIISYSKTKLEWYDASLYPIMATIVGYSLYQIYEGIKTYFSLKKNALEVIFTVLFLALVFGLPYQKIMGRVYLHKDIDYPGERYGYMIEQLVKTHPDLKTFTLLHEGHSTHALFYQLSNTHHRGYDIARIKKLEDAKPESIIMACQPKAIKYLKAHYEWKLIGTKEGCATLQIGAEKIIEEPEK